MQPSVRISRAVFLPIILTNMAKAAYLLHCFRPRPSAGPAQLHRRPEHAARGVRRRAAEGVHRAGAGHGPGRPPPRRGTLLRCAAFCCALCRFAYRHRRALPIALPSLGSPRARDTEPLPLKERSPVNRPSSLICRLAFARLFLRSRLPGWTPSPPRASWPFWRAWPPAGRS